MTVLICANAAGDLAPSLFIMQGTETDNYFSGLPDEEMVSVQPSGFITHDLFEKWMGSFLSHIQGLNQRNLYEGYHLFITDGHQSRLNTRLLWSCLMKKVLVLCLPAHTSHLLQPNDSGLNKTFKSNLDAELQRLASANVTVDKFNLLSLVYQSLHHPNIRMSIVNSYRHIGIEPFDPQKRTSLLDALTPDEEPHLVRMAQLLYKHTDALQAIQEIQGQTRKEPRLNSRRKKSLTTHTQLLTKLDVMSMIELQNLESKIRNMKSEELRNFLIGEGIPETQLIEGTYVRSNKPKYMKVDQLKELALDLMKSRQEEVLRGRLEIVNTRLENPPLALLVSPETGARLSRDVDRSESPASELPQEPRNDSLDSHNNPLYEESLSFMANALHEMTTEEFTHYFNL